MAAELLAAVEAEVLVVASAEKAEAKGGVAFVVEEAEVGWALVVVAAAMVVVAVVQKAAARRKRPPRRSCISESSHTVCSPMLILVVDSTKLRTGSSRGLVHCLSNEHSPSRLANARSVVELGAPGTRTCAGARCRDQAVGRRHWLKCEKKTVGRRRYPTARRAGSQHDQSSLNRRLSDGCCPRAAVLLVVVVEGVWSVVEG